jgi:ribosomal protein S18 acetylase RimI-like enzyme
MLLRKARIKDAQGIARLYLEFWKIHDGIDPLVTLRRKPMLETEKEEAKKDIRKRNPAILVAVDGDEVLGYIIVKIVKASRQLRMKRFGLIDSLVVAEERRRSGVGKKLVSYTHSYLRSEGVSYARLNVYDINTGALRFWEAQGYKPRARMLSREF